MTSETDRDHSGTITVPESEHLELTLLRLERPELMDQLNKAEDIIDDLTAQVAKYKSALEFYASGSHVILDQGDKECDQHWSPDTISGEPNNILAGHGDYEFEDGSFARNALKNEGGSV